MLLLLHAPIPCVAAYMLSFGLRMLLWLHALIPCIAAYILPLFLYFFGTVIPTSFNILMEVFYTCIYCTC